MGDGTKAARLSDWSVADEKRERRQKQCEILLNSIKEFAVHLKVLNSNGGDKNLALYRGADLVSRIIPIQVIELRRFMDDNVVNMVVKTMYKELARSLETASVSLFTETAQLLMGEPARKKVTLDPGKIFRSIRHVRSALKTGHIIAVRKQEKGFIIIMGPVHEGKKDELINELIKNPETKEFVLVHNGKKRKPAEV